MQRLYSTFPNGGPGCGLLILRLGQWIPLYGALAALAWPLVTSTELLVRGIDIIATFLLTIGLVTPAAGAVATVTALCGLLFHFDGNGVSCLIMALALALLGPGVWSVDARLYGRRRIILDELE